MHLRKNHRILSLGSSVILAACNIPCGDDGIAEQQHECAAASATDSESDSETRGTGADSMNSDSITNSNSTNGPGGSGSESETGGTAGPSGTDTDAGSDSMTLTDSDAASDSDGGSVYCEDKDGDGFGDADNCVNVPPGDDPPPDSVDNDGDCDDSDPDTHPGAAENEPELCATDQDGDGWGDMYPDDPGVDPGGDCNDADAIVFESCLCQPVDDELICQQYHWSYELIDGLLGQGQEWVWAADSSEVCEVTNGRPTALICNEWRPDPESREANVRFEIKAEEDDDFIGFVFGWQDWGHYYLLHWKRGAQLVDLGNLGCLDLLTFENGMMIKKIDTAAPQTLDCVDMHAEVDTFRADLLWHPDDAPETTVGWEYNQPYLFNVAFGDEGFVVTISTEPDHTVIATMTVDDVDYGADGQVGLFSLSQVNTCFAGFASIPCEE
ncbi:MAG: hypothetical protein KC636_03090 [Myxococcales bacterium]|nr:hypothetical protein [Myxococcales bacterium]